MEEFLLIALVALGVLLALPIAAWVSAVRSRQRVGDLAAIVSEQREDIRRLEAQIARLQREMRAPLATDAQPSAPEAAPVSEPKPTAVRPAPAPVTPVAPAPAAPPPVTPAVAPPPPRETPKPSAPVRGIEPPATPAAPRAAARPEPSRGAASTSIARETPPAPPRPPAPPVPPEPPAPSAPWFDWESLVGVKLFSAIAGIALVLAAVFFLRYSIEHGWLQPPVRVAIGIVVALALLIGCEFKAARQYPVTANALDAAGISILFSTFFAAHALWNLIPAMMAFVLLAIVTALAVLLSIRRESLFIAVLGLLGGFATPALLSTGENRPIPLFAYLMLLNVGLAWVAYRQRWPILTVLTLVCTTVYQWGWVYKFLAESDLSLAMGIFLIFPIATLAALVLGRVRADASQSGEGALFERTALAAAVLPLFFAVYLAAVPQYGARPWLLFGFLFLIDAGLLAVALMRREELLHAAGALATLFVTAVWLAMSYTSAGAYAALVFCALFAIFYACAPTLAARVGRPLEGAGTHAIYAAPLMLFIPAVLARIEPRFAAPLPLFGMLLGVVLLIAWRAAAERRGPLYFIAAFFAIATQAVWSWQHLTPQRLGMAVAIYAVFGMVAILVPVLARRAGRALEPVEGSGYVLLASLGLLLSLSASSSVAPAALWALALLLAIINAGLFVESAAGGLPSISLVGSVFSWLILASWWWSAAGAVGVLPSLTVLVILTFVTLGGHAWARTQSASPDEQAGFGQGLSLGLVGHLFLLFVAANREWSLPPWPVFGALVVITLAVSVVSLVTRAAALHAAGAVAAAAIVTVWTVAAGAPWVLVALAASAAVSAYALAWITVARRFGAAEVATRAAGATLFIGEATAIATATVTAQPPFAALLAAHVVNLALILTLTWRSRWRNVALLAAATAWAAVYQFQTGREVALVWPQLLTMVSVLYAVFVAYPFVLGARAQGERDPHLAAVLASAMFFFAAHRAFMAGDLSDVIGIVPVVAGLVMAVLLRQLLAIEPAGRRDIGRLAIVAGAALAFVTVAIPLQLKEQWITIGWALEGAALAWLYRRVPHRGLLYACVALLATVFVRLALNSDVLEYEPRGTMRIFNWYLYAYLISAGALFAAGWWLSKTDDRLVEPLPRPSRLLPAGAVVLLFLLLNIEIADYFATESTEMFRFGASVSQDLTYTIGWLVFGIGLLAAGIYLKTRAARVTAVTLIAITTLKCFLYDLGSFEGLYRVASLVGLAMSLALVALALQKYVLARPKETA